MSSLATDVFVDFMPHRIGFPPQRNLLPINTQFHTTDEKTHDLLAMNPKFDGWIRLLNFCSLDSNNNIETYNSNTKIST